MKPDEELTKQQGRPVIKGVMEHDDLDLGDTPVEPAEESFDSRVIGEANARYREGLKDIEPGD
jgi:hypothetical protein